jgi:hypothetical protein
MQAHRPASLLGQDGRVRQRGAGVPALAAGRARVAACLLALLAACSSSHPTRLAESSGGSPGSGDETGGESTRGGTGGKSSAAAGRAGRSGAGAGAHGDDNMGGADEAGGAAGAAGPSSVAGAGGEGGANSSCDIQASWTLSEKIQTVASVEWLSELADIEDAHIEFGLDQSYGMTAPVDLAAPSHRTLLVGMKPSRVYHFRIVAHARTGTCTTADATLATGPVPNGLPQLSVTDHGGEHFSGFLLTSFLNAGPAFMLDSDGDYVWTYGTEATGRAALSHDGKYVWYGNVNLAGDQPSMKRVTLDGLEETDFTDEFSLMHHDFTLLADDTITFLAHNADSDLVIERAPDGSTHQVLDVGAVLGSTHTHANSIHYHPEDDTYTLGELAHDSFVKFGRDGHVIWILGGEKSDFSGDDASWDGQHGHRLLAPDRMLFFNNGGANETSAAVELELDLDARTVKRVWQYQPGPHCLIYGDVERLPNQNTLVAFSTLGLIHEVTPDGELVRELSWSLGGALGYVTKLASPYPPFD